jgi:hypothetical protein
MSGSKEKVRNSLQERDFGDCAMDNITTSVEALRYVEHMPMSKHYVILGPLPNWVLTKHASSTLSSLLYI